MRPLLLVLSLAAVPVWTSSPATAQESAPWLTAKPESVEHWKDLRYGMFVHWGPNCQKGGEIGWSRKGPRRGRDHGGTGDIPVEVYDNLYKTFDPVEFDANEWVRIAKDAGMKYMVVTSKHHDGFSMFASEQTDYDIRATPFGRDVIEELSAACARGGIEFGVYYSPRDWYHPDFATDRHDRYLEFYLGQLRELATNYGKLLVLWFDGLDSPRELWKDTPTQSFRMLRTLQPDILLNNRGGLPGDFDTPEQRIGAFQPERPWETCMTICRQWSWKPDDRMKSLEECVHTLVRTVGGDGNLLFNVGPMPDGRIEPRQVERLREEGAWLEPRGEAFYATRGGPFRPGKWGVSTHAKNRVFLHVLDWSDEEELELPPIGPKVVEARLLPGGEEVDWEQSDDVLRVTVPAANRDELDTIVVLTLDGDAAKIPPVAVVHRSGSLAYGKPAGASNVFREMAEYAPGRAFDDDDSTRWATDAGTSACWIEVDLEEERSVGRIVIDQYEPRIEEYELQLRRGGEWVTFHRGSKLEKKATIRFEPVAARRFRLNVLKASEGPTIYEIQLMAP